LFWRFFGFLKKIKIKIIILILNVAKFVLFIIFLYFFLKAHLGKYKNFLECKYVRKKYLSKFPDVDILLPTYKAYWISTIFSKGSDTLEILIEKIFCEDRDENIKNDISNMANCQNNSDMSNTNK
jgi:hypothetical protein